ncbi:DUF6350 family protein [Nocardioides sp. cx-169]|uniref:cell division protein PerM n=1 Tax=Nocardioides sp. cx-169 TaxID=2899080 RepID=UPI001E531779|nr:DUF6350 family protein [Nocardioides sp. cx-169]MCD4535772.1 DUF6350 family protein [Nocardioides sp. cx-169]
MTSLLPSTRSSSTRDRRRSEAEVARDLATRRPLVLLAALGGIAAAVSTLLVCLAVGVVGWFLTDAGAHGTPRDGLRSGALGWLLAHGSGVSVQGAAVTIVPLGVTVLCAWAIWRVGHRVGESVSGHGPDATRIADGERDLTVPVATIVFALGYVATALVAVRLAGTPATSPDTGRVVLWSLVLTALAGGCAIAVGSGRAAIWASFVPAWARAALAGCRRILVTWLVVSLATFAVALVLDFSTAVNVMSQLHTDAGDATLFTLLSAMLLPNATIFSGAYLLGPGFTVGVGTLVSPGAVVVGPLPMFPLLAALPDAGPPAGWTTYLVAVPVLVAALGAAWAQRRVPTLRWEEGAVRGLAGGVLAGLVFGLLAAVAGGAAGPGRMRDVGPLAFDVLVYAVAAFGIGALLGGLATTWWQRRGADADEQA